MKILALSDVGSWDGYMSLLNRYKPSVTALAGDLRSDGGADFWLTALELIPAFRREKRTLRKRLGVVTVDGCDFISHGSLDDFSKSMRALESRYQSTPAFFAARKRCHVDKFYDFLSYAGRMSTVLVVKGDHDDDFEDDYDPQRIDAIPGCREISGKTIAIDDFLVLGMGFEQAGYRRPLRRSLADHKGQVDIVIAHAPQRNVRLLAELRPRLMIRGHLGGGQYLIDGVPSVFTSSGYAMVEIERHGTPRIRSSSPRARWWEASLRRDYDWLRPYPNR